MQKTDRLPETREENLLVQVTIKGSRELSSLHSQGTQTLGLTLQHLSTAKGQKPPTSQAHREAVTLTRLSLPYLSCITLEDSLTLTSLWSLLTLPAVKHGRKRKLLDTSICRASCPPTISIQEEQKDLHPVLPAANLALQTELATVCNRHLQRMLGNT